jgi:TM2 domain-containing membrane protein YozV
METTRPTEDWNNPPARREENKKVVAGILGILLGYLGIHKFILGYTKEGIIQILLNLACGLGGLIGLIEGIIYLTKTDEEFYQTYQVGKKGWF